MRIKLKQAFDLQMGKTPARNLSEYWDGDRKWVSIADIGQAGKYISKTKECITDVGVRGSGIKIVPKGTVIMSFKLSIGKTAITAEDMYTNEAIMAFIDKGVYKIDSSYFYHLCCGKDWTAGTNKAVMGLTLNKATLSEIEIPLPDISVQREIASILDKIDAIMEKRREQLNELDRFVKSRFIELFGDPLHPMHSKPLGDVAVLERGRFSPRPRNDPRYYGGSYPFIQTGDIANCGHRLSTYKQTLNEKGIHVSKKFPVGTIVIAIVGATIGATAILEIEVYAPDSVIGISVDPKQYNAVFMETLLQFWQPELLRIAPESARANINLGILQNIPIIDTDLQLQKQFAAFVEQTDKSKLAVQKSLEELETLKKSLMQQYFG